MPLFIDKAVVLWTGEEIKKGQIVTQGIYKQLLEYISNRINSYHGINKSTSFYDLLMGNRLQQLSDVVYVCYKETDYSGPTMARQSLNVRPMSCLADISKACTSKGFHAEIKNLILALQHPGDSNLDSLDLNANHALVKLGKSDHSIKDRLGLPSKDKVLISNYKMNCSLLERMALQLEWSSWARFNNLLFPFECTVPINWEWRKTELETVAGWKPSLVKFVCWITLAYLPVEVLEAFKQIDAFCEELDLERPDVVVSNSGLHSQSLFNHLVNRWRESGTKLWYAQHGGSYGTEKNLAIQAYEIRVSDQFFSWGWKDISDKVLPLPPVYSFKVKDRKIKDESFSIYLNCCDYPEVQYRLTCQPSNELLQNFYRETHEFLGFLSEDIRVCVRPYPKEYEFPFAKLLEANFPAATFDHSRTLPSVRYMKHDLIVHNYFNTSALESLAMNIPTICFYNSVTMNFQENFLPFELVLRKLGILHTTADSAAKFISSPHFNLSKWWMNDELQSQRLRFCRIYANITPNWKSVMSSQLKALRKLAQ